MQKRKYFSSYQKGFSDTVVVHGGTTNTHGCAAIFKRYVEFIFSTTESTHAKYTHLSHSCGWKAFLLESSNLSFCFIRVSAQASFLQGDLLDHDL